MYAVRRRGGNCWDVILVTVFFLHLLVSSNDDPGNRGPAQKKSFFKWSQNHFWVFNPTVISVNMIQWKFRPKKLCGRCPLAVSKLKMIHTNKIPNFTCYLSHICTTQSTRIWNLLSMPNCLNKCLKDVWKVLGHDSKFKWVLGATTGTEIMPNKMHHFSTSIKWVLQQRFLFLGACTNFYCCTSTRLLLPIFWCLLQDSLSQFCALRCPAAFPNTSACDMAMTQPSAQSSSTHQGWCRMCLVW